MIYILLCHTADDPTQSALSVPYPRHDDESTQRRLVWIQQVAHMLSQMFFFHNMIACNLMPCRHPIMPVIQRTTKTPRSICMNVHLIVCFESGHDLCNTS